MAPSAKNVRSAGAFVEFFADDSLLVRGLRRAQRKLRAFGAAVQSMGRDMFAAGAGLVAPMITAAKMFADVGSDLVDMSQRTGASVESLSELSYAAEQSGSDLTALESGLRKMQKAIVAAAKGSGSARQAFWRLGLSAADLMRLSPDQQFELIADRMAQIQNPAQKAALAMEIFGRNNTSLLPLMANGAAGIRELRQQAQSLGLTMTTESAQAAEAFGDTLNTVWRVLRMGAVQIGAALEPTLSDLAQTFIRVSAIASNWIRENQQLIAGALKLAVGVAAAGAALFVAGSLIARVGAGLGMLALVASGFGAAIGAIVVVLGALLTPIGAVTAGIIALGAYLVHASGAGSAALGWLGRQFQVLKMTAIQAFGGISDAMAAGDLGLAARILWLTLKLEWQKGISALNHQWVEAKRFFAAVWTEAVYDAAAIAANAWASLQTAWTETVDFLADAWSLFTAGLIQSWHTTIGFIREAWVRLKSLFDSGIDVEAEVSRINEETAGKSGVADVERNRAIFAREQQRQQRLSQIAEDRIGALSELERMRDAERQRNAQQFASEVRDSDAALANARREWQAALDAAAEKRKLAEAGADAPDRKQGLQDMLAHAGDDLEQLGASGRLATSADIRSAQGLETVLAALQPRDGVAEIAQHTQEMSSTLQTITHKIDRSNAILDRIHRDQGQDILSLRDASTTATA